MIQQTTTSKLFNQYSQQSRKHCDPYKQLQRVDSKQKTKQPPPKKNRTKNRF